MDELPTERTATSMMAFMTEGNTWMPAFWIEITKGDAAALALPPVSRRGSSYRTRSPTRKSDTT